MATDAVAKKIIFRGNIWGYSLRNPVSFCVIGDTIRRRAPAGGCVWMVYASHAVTVAKRAATRAPAA